MTCGKAYLPSREIHESAYIFAKDHRHCEKPPGHEGDCGPVERAEPPRESEVKGPWPVCAACEGRHGLARGFYLEPQWQLAWCVLCEKTKTCLRQEKDPRVRSSTPTGVETAGEAEKLEQIRGYLDAAKEDIAASQKARALRPGQLNEPLAGAKPEPRPPSPGSETRDCTDKTCSDMHRRPHAIHGKHVLPDDVDLSRDCMWCFRPQAPNCCDRGEAASRTPSVPAAPASEPPRESGATCERPHKPEKVCCVRCNRDVDSYWYLCCECAPNLADARNLAAPTSQKPGESGMDIEARARRIAFGADDTVGNVLDRVRTNEEQWEARLADANREWNAAVRDQRTAERERDAALAKLKYVEQALRSNEDALIEQRDVQRAARLTAEREAFQLRSLLRRCEPCIPDGSELAKDVRRGLSGTTEAGK